MKSLSSVKNRIITILSYEVEGNLFSDFDFYWTWLFQGKTLTIDVLSKTATLSPDGYNGSRGFVLL